MILLCDITRSADTIRIATQEYVDGSGNAYRGDIISDVDIVKSIPDAFYGIAETEPVTLSLSNVDNGVDSTYDELIAAEDFRGCAAVLKRDDGEILLAGVVTAYTLGLESTITIREKDESFNTLYPSTVVTTDIFTDTAVDIGAPVPIAFGYAKNIICPNVQNYTPATSTTTDTESDGTALTDATASFTDDDIGRYAHNVTTGKYALITARVSGTQLTVDDAIFLTTGDIYGIRCFDYVVSVGPIEGLWEDAANGRGVKRNGSLVPTTEYTFQTTEYTGYATIRFAFEQVDFSSSRYSITADVKGLKLFGAGAASRNFALIVATLLNNATHGLGQSINAVSFAAAALALPLTSWMCDFGISGEQRQFRDVMNDILFACRSYLWKNASGEWCMTVDGTGSSVATFGENDGYWNNCDVQECSANPTDESIKTGHVDYDGKRISLACHTAYGEDKVYKVPCVIEDVTAKKILSYVYGRAVYADKKLTLLTGSDGAAVSAGEVITVTSAVRGLSSATYRVIRSARNLLSCTLECEAYSASIFSDQTISEPTAQTDSTKTYSLNTIVEPDITFFNNPDIPDDADSSLYLVKLIDGVLYYCADEGPPAVWEPIGGAALNNKAEIILADCTYTVPVSGWYRISALAGAGSGARIAAGAASGGGGGEFAELTKYLHKDDAIAINVGVGGAAPSGDGADGNDGTDTEVVCSARGISFTVVGGKKGTQTATNGVTVSGGPGGTGGTGTVDFRFDGGKGGDAQHLTGGIEEGGGGAAGSPYGDGGDGGDAIAASTAIIAAAGGGAVGGHKGGDVTATGQNGAGAGTGGPATGTTAGPNRLGQASVIGVDGVDRSAALCFESLSDIFRSLTGGGATTTNNSGPGAGGPAYVNADSGTGRAGMLGGSGGGRTAGIPGFGGGSGGAKLTGIKGGDGLVAIERVG